MVVELAGVITCFQLFKVKVSFLQVRLWFYTSPGGFNPFLKLSKNRVRMAVLSRGGCDDPVGSAVSVWECGFAAGSNPISLCAFNMASCLAHFS